MKTTSQTIQAARLAACQWFSAHYRHCGSMLYCYLPSTNSYSQDCNQVRLLAASWQYLVNCRSLGLSPEPTSFKLLEQLNVSYQKAGFGQLLIIEGKLKPAYSAFALLYLLQLPAEQAQPALALSLYQGLLSLIAPSGQVLGGSEKSEVFYAFEVVLALLHYQEQTPNDSERQQVAKVFAYYQQQWPQLKATAMISWLSASYYLYSQNGAEASLTDFVINLNHWYIKQKRAGLKAGPKSAQTSLAESLWAAASLAREQGDALAAQRFAKYGQRALANICQLQCSVNQAEQYPAKQLAIGGFGHNLSDASQRCDYTQHAISALAWASIFNNH
jgi:hypothetical protein